MPFSQIRSAMRLPARGRLAPVEQPGQPGRRAEAGDDRRIRVEEGPEAVVPDPRRADQVQLLDQAQPRVPRLAGADRRGLLDHRPRGGDEVEVAGAPVVPLQAPGDDRRLVDGRGLPLGPAVDRVLLEPVGEGAVLAPDRREPLEDAPADLGVAEPRQRVADPDRLARPAVGAQAAVEPRGDRSPLGVGMKRRGQGRAAEADGVGRLGKVQVRQRLDEAVPLLAGRLLDLVEVGAAEPGQGGPEPVLERARDRPASR